MLRELHIENVAVIERADLELGPGLNILTGETGAGKSILVDAMHAILGSRASRELVRTGAEKAVVCATFDPEQSGDRKSGSAGMPRPISYAVFCLKKQTGLWRLP